MPTGGRRCRGSRGIKVSLRLCFVKLPGTPDRRIFRDVMLLEEPEDKCYQDLSDIVERKLAFMEIPPADFTVFYTEETTAAAGDRVVVDDAYLSELIAGWFEQLYARVKRKEKRRHRCKGRGESARNNAVRTYSFSQNAQREPYLLGASPDPQKTKRVAASSQDACTHSASTDSSSNSSNESDDSDAGPLDIAVTFDIEVNRLRNIGNEAETSGGGVALREALDQRTPSATTTTTTTAPASQGQRGVVGSSAKYAPSPTSATPGEGGGGQGLPRSGPPACVPLTVQNLTALMQQSTTLSPPSPPPLPVAAVAPNPSQQQPEPSEALVRVADLVCPPQPPHFFLRCVAVDIRFKVPKPGLSVGEIDLCDAADPRHVITGVTFDASVQKEIKENLRCDGRQVLELRRVYVRRKNEMDIRYATNTHPLLLRIDRSSKVDVVQVLTVPIFSRAPVVSSSSAALLHQSRTTNSHLLSPDHVFSVGEGANMRTDGGVVELTDLTRLRSSSELAHGAGLPGVTGLSSSSSSSTGPRRTTFTIGSGHNTVGSSGSGALISGVVPSTYGNQLRQQQQQLLMRAAQLQQQQQQNALPYEPGVIPVTLRDVRAREPLVEQHEDKENRRKERIRRKVEVSQACILCGLDISEGHEDACMAAVRRMLAASTRNRGTFVPTMEQLHDALCDRRPLLLLRERQCSASQKGEASTGNGRKTQRPTRLLCQQTFVNLQTRTNHVVHCRCAHLCTAYQSGGSLEDIAWCDLPMQVCSLCGLPGAFVSCYHPDCNEMYHGVCALFSGGYVNFGKKDPFLPCPACPRHTQVILTHGKKAKPVGAGDGVLLADESCWADDDIAFDSRVVAAGDLRDPDENEGE